MALADAGKIFVVATPIGNLEDISARALRVLAAVDVIAAEDTRHTAQLCQHFQITNNLISMHNFNEHDRVDGIVSRVRRGESIAIVSDAGTPLIADPGYLLVKAAREQDLEVIPIPGPSALVAALSVAGLSAERFVFEGFLPAKRTARLKCLKKIITETRTSIFYEAPHRILDMLEDLASVFAERQVVVARELTKVYETILTGSASSIVQEMQADANQVKGEFVVLLAGGPAELVSPQESLDVDQLLELLLEELPAGKAASIASKVSRMSRKELYGRAMLLKGGAEQ